MTIYIYTRANKSDPLAEKYLKVLHHFSKSFNEFTNTYIDNYSENEIEHNKLYQLFEKIEFGDILLIDSIHRLHRLPQELFQYIKNEIQHKNLKIVVVNLPSTHSIKIKNDEKNNSDLELINSLIIDLMSNMTTYTEKTPTKGYKASGKKSSMDKHKKILELNKKGLSKKEIAKIIDYDISSIYRIIKLYKTKL